MGLMEAVRGAFGLLFNGDPVLWGIVWVSLILIYFTEVRRARLVEHVESS